MSVVHVYICGHSVTEGPASSLDAHPQQHVFVLGPCPESECASTDTSWFVEHSSRPGPAAMETLGSLSENLHNVKTVLSLNLETFDNLDTALVGDLLLFADADIEDLLLADNRKWLTERLFHLEALAQHIGNMRRFADRASQRPFFDYCRRSAVEAMEEAMNYIHILAATVTDCKRREALLDQDLSELPTAESIESKSDIEAHMGPRDYDPYLGTDEIHLLRLAGPMGQEILSRPLDEQMLQIATTVAEYTRAELTIPPSTTVRPSLVSSVQAGADSFATPLSPASAANPILAWLDQLEDAMEIEDAATILLDHVSAASPVNKAPKKLSKPALWVHSDINGMFEHDLPGLERKAM